MRVYVPPSYPTCPSRCRATADPVCRDRHEQGRGPRDDAIPGGAPPPNWRAGAGATPRPVWSTPPRDADPGDQIEPHLQAAAFEYTWSDVAAIADLPNVSADAGCAEQTRGERGRPSPPCRILLAWFDRSELRQRTRLNAYAAAEPIYGHGPSGRSAVPTVRATAARSAADHGGNHAPPNTARPRCSSAFVRASLTHAPWRQITT